MAASDNLASLLGGLSNCMPNKETNQKNNAKSEDAYLGPGQILVIGGLLTNVLQVESVLVGKDQVVNIVLSGSLKRKTELDKMLDDIGTMSFDEVIAAIVSRVSG